VGFFQYIEQLLRRSVIIIHFITPAFLRSEFCMLEVGAAWAQRKSFPILAPTVTVESLRDSPLASLQLTTLTSGDGLDKLNDELSHRLGLTMRASGWAPRRDRTIRRIEEALKESRSSYVARLAAVGVRDHHFELWSLGTDGRASHTWWPRDDGAEQWNEPYDFPVPGRIVDLAASSRGPGHAEVFVVDNRGMLWHRWWTQESRWSGWHIFHSPKVAPPICACSRMDGHIEVFVLDDSSNSVIHRWSYAPGEWSEWSRLDEAIINR
jgi:hypothetical protein